MLKELISLLGLPINSPEIKAFVEKNNLKYPKKETYSRLTSTSSTSLNTVNISGKKVGKKFLGKIKVDEFEFELYFQAGRWNPEYSEIPAERGGIFYYRLGNIELDTKNQLELLNIIKVPSKQTPLEDLLKILGSRKKTTHGNYSWTIPIDKEKDICALVHYQSFDGEVSAYLAIPERPVISDLFSDSLIGEIKEVLGKPINAPEVKSFIEKYHGVYPKKNTIDASIDPSSVPAGIRYETEGQYYKVYIDSGIILIFGLKKKTEKYFPLPAKKENHYYPILNTVSFWDFYNFNQEDNIVSFPMGVQTNDSLDTILKKWGKPLRGDEKSGFYYWEVPIDKNGHFVLEAYYRLKDSSLQAISRFDGPSLDITLKTN